MKLANFNGKLILYYGENVKKCVYYNDIVYLHIGIEEKLNTLASILI